MLPDYSHLSTGLPGLDRVFQGLRPGDNVVWQVDSIADYLPFVKPYCAWAIARGKRLIYFRFAKHDPLLSACPQAEVHELHPEAGFETFITQVHNVIQDVGQEAFYVFDALSDLTFDQYSDRMLGNFYLVTCPQLFSLRTIAYYALLKNYHSFHAASPIAETTQILVDVYRHHDKLYVHPRKVKYRYSPTMHMLHAWEGEDFRPVTESNVTADVLTHSAWSGLTFGAERPGGWTRTFIEAEETLSAFRRGEVPQSKVDGAFHHCLRTAISRDEWALRLAEKYMALPDVLEIKKRMVSSGLIGGKSVGMLLARAILRKAGPRWDELLEPHDSFYVGSEVFYTFLVQNHCWRLRQKQKDPRTFLEGADEARQRMLMGTFPDNIRDRFAIVLDYFGLSPFIVRSSSLLEDNYGNAFAGKYESVFCANQGPRHIRLDDLLNAVRTIYASSMSEEALTYRAERGVLDKDEQMALLIQRVSGGQHGNMFFPQAAGVGLSFNPYVWSAAIDPKAGLLRLVFGLGTRAVDRADDDYTRIVALNEPTRRPEADLAQVRRYAQRKVDVLNLDTNALDSIDFVDLAASCTGLPLDRFVSPDEQPGTPGVLTFDGLLTETAFAADMREMLQILQDAYGHPVDIEFTVNFSAEGRYKINLLQCRTLQVRGEDAASAGPAHAAADTVVLHSRGPVIGPSRALTLDRLIYIVPPAYARLTSNERYAVARVIGQLTHLEDLPKKKNILLLGPGRWGTSTPALGVPVAFREIRPAAVICEMVVMHDGLVPDVSLGTHFFGDLIENDILYAAFWPGQAGYTLDTAYFGESPNQLARLVPEAAKWENVVRVIDTGQARQPGELRLRADTMAQTLECFVAG